MSKKSLNTVALFSGGGGLDLGFSVSDFNLIFSSDIDPFSCRTLLKNQGKKDYLKKHPVKCRDIKDLSGTDIKEYTNNREIDFVIGGPPCQAFSVFGKRKGLEDPRGNLIYEYVRLIEELNPEGFLFENVTGLKTINEGKIYLDLVKTLSINGKYEVTVQEYDVANFGVPQFRKRLFFIGSKEGTKVPQMDATHIDPESLFNNHYEFNTVGEVLSDMPKPITNWKNEPKLNGHVGRNHSKRIIDRYASLNHGERDHKTRINKLDPKKPSFTIIVGSDKGGGKGHIHPFDAREVTPRESARIQTFPDWWEFDGTGRHIIRQVGNAVPPLFAAILASHISKHIFKISSEISYSKILEKMDLTYMKNGN